MEEATCNKGEKGDTQSFVCPRATAKLWVSPFSDAQPGGWGCRWKGRRVCEERNWLFQVQRAPPNWQAKSVYLLRGRIFGGGVADRRPCWTTSGHFQCPVENSRWVDLAYRRETRAYHVGRARSPAENLVVGACTLMASNSPRRTS